MLLDDGCMLIDDRCMLMVQIIINPIPISNYENYRCVIDLDDAKQESNKECWKIKDNWILNVQSLSRLATWPLLDSATWY